MPFNKAAPFLLLSLKILLQKKFGLYIKKEKKERKDKCLKEKKGKSYATQVLSNISMSQKERDLFQGAK
jgi:hypothetical protein